MILKELRRNRNITVKYYENRLLKTCDGRIANLDINEQTLILKDEQEKVWSIPLSNIIEIKQLRKQ